MATKIEILMEQDPTPLVKIFANKFSKALDNASFANNVEQFRGCFALASAKDPQSITITVTEKAISICRGIKDSARIVIHMDFDNPVNPRVEGLYRHPRLAMKISKLLAFPVPDWVDALNQFWDDHHTYTGMPNGILIHCEDEDRDVMLGSEPADMHITGKAETIADVFSGGVVFVQAVIQGKLKSISSFEHAVVLSDVTVQMLLGER